MEPIKPTFTDHKQRLRIYSGDDTDPARYWVWYEGRDRVIVRKRGESSADLYQRVLEQVQDMRLAVRYGYWQGQELNFAHLYAGVKPSAADQRERMREWCSSRLYHEADPRNNDDGTSRVAALVALAELHGLHAPRRYAVNLPVSLLALVNCELSRRRAHVGVSR